MLYAVEVPDIVCSSVSGNSPELVVFCDGTPASACGDWREHVDGLLSGAFGAAFAGTGGAAVVEEFWGGVTRGHTCVPGFDDGGSGS